MTDPYLEFPTKLLITTAQYSTFTPAFNLIMLNYNQYSMIKVYLNDILVATLLDSRSLHDLIHPDITAKARIFKDNKTILLIRFQSKNPTSAYIVAKLYSLCINFFIVEDQDIYIITDNYQILLGCKTLYNF